MPASPSTVVTQGFGAFGSIHLLPTLGFGIGSPESGYIKRDDIVLKDIRDRLATIGYFEEISVGRVPSEAKVSSDRSAVAWLKRSGWTEEKISAEYDKLHIADFTLTLLVIGRDEFERTARLMQIEEAAHQAIENQGLAGFCLPAWTTLKRGRDLGERDMASMVEIVGSFRYIHEDSRERSLDDPS